MLSRFLILMAGCGLSLAAQTFPLASLEDAPGRGDWKVQLGAMVLTTPKTPGAEESRVLPLPVISAEYKDTVFLGSSRIGVGLGGGVHLLKVDHVTWDLGLGVGEGRRESRAEELAGMGNRSASLFAGTALRLKWGLLRGGLSVAAGLRDEAGVRSTLSLGVGGRLGGPWLGGITASATYADAKAMAYDFGVDPAQASVRTALIAAGDGRLHPGEDRVWSPRSGLQEVALGAHLEYLVDARWRWFGIAKAASLQGDAKSSPLTRRADNLTLGAGLAYRF
jgi:outer membrane scaffolding protein for murein synthesis (MipA/OmpV family)